MLADVVAASACGPKGGAPQVLLVCPPALGHLDQFASEFEGAEEKSRALARHFATVADGRPCRFLDAGKYVSPSDVDGIHLDHEAHVALGVAVAEVVRATIPIV